MSLFSTLTRTAPKRVFLSLLLGTLAGIIYALLIPIVTNSLVVDDRFQTISFEQQSIFGLQVSNYRFAVFFLAAVLTIYVARTISQLSLIWVVITATSNLRKQYFYRIVRAPLHKLEMLGSPRLIASITTDVRSILDGAQRVPDILINSVSIAGMMLFVLYLNSDVFLVVCGAIVFGVLSFFVPVVLGNRFLRRARASVDNLHKAIKGNIYGVKELKLGAERRTDYFKNVLLKAEADVKSANKKAATILTAAVNYGDTISLFVIGYITYFFVSHHAISTQELVAVLMVLLYVTGPISTLIQAVPELMVANVSLRKLEELFAELPQEKISRELVAIPRWSELRFVDVFFRYGMEETGSQQVAATTIGGTDDFSVGPISFAVKKGEIAFIVGGNGSGKSTLAKLLTGHYLPHSGDIFLGNTKIDKELVSSYRDRVSAIYSDYFLFDQLLGAASDTPREKIERYLHLLRLSEKVSLEGDRFSTLSLSDGQRKRLALLVSFLEDKEIYLFDEWAADQDPVFKDAFYYEILPSLRAKNKVVVAISHDDRYFDVADKVLTMEFGRLVHVEERNPADVEGLR